jgi:hypothetical protein
VRWILAALCLSACASDFHRVHRGDWVRSGGEVLPRAEAIRRALAPSAPAAPADLLAVTSPVSMRRGEVLSLVLGEKMAAELAVAGAAVLVYWTQGRLVHLRAVARGRSRLRLTPRLAPPRVIEIRVE